ncbi:MAG: hypothetical protein ACK4NR_09765 [Micavibrio sp.]
MKIYNIILLSITLISLSACACGRSTEYEGSPYKNARTAGTGQVDEGCFRRAIF